MNKNEFRGLKEVFIYTFSQYVKTKSYIITTIIMAFAALVVFPFMAAFGKGSGSETENKVEKVYVINNSDVVLDDEALTSSLNANDIYDGVSFEIYKGNEEETESLKSEIVENSASEVILTIERDLELGGFTVEASYDGDGILSRDNVSDIASVFADWFYDYKTGSLSLKDDVKDIVTGDVSYEIINDYDFLNEIEGAETEAIGQSGFWVVYTAIFVSYMIIAMSSGLISSKIVEEKANRIVEYLMTTVRPMALITGKIMAMMLVTFINCGVVGICAFISSKVAKNLFGKTGADLLTSYVDAETLSNISADRIVLAIIVIMLGIFIYGIIAGLFGASVSKMEELQQGMRGYSMLILVAFLLSYASLMVMQDKGFNAFVWFTVFFPFTSSMVMPGAMCLGEVTILGVIACIVIQIVSALILLWFVSLIYEGVIVATGEPIKIGKMFTMAKQKLMLDAERRKSHE